MENRGRKKEAEVMNMIRSKYTVLAGCVMAAWMGGCKQNQNEIKDSILIAAEGKSFVTGARIMGESEGFSQCNLEDLSNCKVLIRECTDDDFYKASKEGKTKLYLEDCSVDLHNPIPYKAYHLLFNAQFSLEDVVGLDARYSCTFRPPA